MKNHLPGDREYTRTLCGKKRHKLVGTVEETTCGSCLYEVERRGGYTLPEPLPEGQCQCNWCGALFVPVSGRAKSCSKACAKQQAATFALQGDDRP